MSAYHYADMPLIRVYAPEVFQDAEFREWFVSRVQGRNSSGDAVPSIATWHGEANKEFHENSDFFMTVDLCGVSSDGSTVADGSESDMPTKCWRQLLAVIDEACEAAGLGPRINVLAWVSNMEDPRAVHRLKSCDESKPVHEMTSDELECAWLACEHYINDPVDLCRIPEAMQKQLEIENEQNKRERRKEQSRRQPAYLIVICDPETNAIKEATVWSSPEWEQSRALPGARVYVAWQVTVGSFQDGIDYILQQIARPEHRYHYAVNHLSAEQLERLQQLAASAKQETP